jgi:hypothetical protein
MEGSKGQMIIDTMNLGALAMHIPCNVKYSQVDGNTGYSLAS